MTREEAERECERRAREDPERLTHTWLSKELAVGHLGVVVKVDLPPAASGDITETRAELNGRQPPTTRARRQPQQRLLRRRLSFLTATAQCPELDSNQRPFP